LNLFFYTPRRTRQGCSSLAVAVSCRTSPRNITSSLRSHRSLSHLHGLCLHVSRTPRADVSLRMILRLDVHPKSSSSFIDRRCNRYFYMQYSEFNILHHNIYIQIQCSKWFHYFVILKSVVGKIPRDYLVCKRNS